MYPDPKRVRDNRVVIRLDDYEHALLAAMANYKGQPLSTFLRDLLMQEADAAIEARQQDTQRTD